ncbi:hypothetical protein NA56DRAFT_700072 [Hyaloscypha hepaticicola]|uniref:Uncharacterized protein n=1 Tax=Hyaloscypha hepaticicola TaxID=2082293 RepID=A0A2J6QDU6_9HELO|nr:hypothetical protein NA56DRAFT_700072 [Hyaloscypha hepaticicola]
MRISNPCLIDTTTLCELCILVVNDVISGERFIGKERWTTYITHYDAHEDGGMHLNCLSLTTPHHSEIQVLGNFAARGCILCSFILSCTLSDLGARSPPTKYRVEISSWCGVLNIYRERLPNDAFEFDRKRLYFFEPYTQEEFLSITDLRSGALAPYDN